MKEDNEKLLVENKEPNVEKNDDTEFEEIFICYKLSCCCMTIYIILSIIKDWFVKSTLIFKKFKKILNTKSVILKQ